MPNDARGVVINTAGGLLVYGYTLNEWVAILTALYLLGQLGLLVPKYWQNLPAYLRRKIFYVITLGGTRMTPLKQTLLAGGTVVLTSTAAMSFLSTWEEGPAKRHVVYADELAGGLPTVCAGITPHTSPYKMVIGDYWSAEKCAEVEAMVVAKTQLRLSDCITGDVSQPVFDALTSHAHNFGVAATCASRAVGLINAGELHKGCDALAHGPDGRHVWAYVGSTFIPGLYNRRHAERKLCLSGLPQDLQASSAITDCNGSAR